MLQIRITPKAILKIVVCFAIVFTSVQCNTSKVAKPEEFYNSVNTELEPSVINIPLKFYKTELLKAINDKIGDMLYEDTDMKDDGLALRAKKRENITIDINEKEISYRVPVDLWIKKMWWFPRSKPKGLWLWSSPPSTISNRTGPWKRRLN